DIKALKPRDGIDPAFLFYALFAQRDTIRQLTGEASHGTKKLETDVAKAIKIKIPTTLPEQQGIAGIAGAYDQLIENNRQRIELLERSAQLLFQEWFIRLHYPGHEHDRIADGVPTGWKRSDLGKLVRNFDSKRVPLSVLEREQRPGKYPYYGAANVLD